MRKLNFHIATTIATLLLSQSAKADDPFVDNDNDDGSLLVFVSGLGGKKTWDSLVSILDKDESLKRFDVYVFDSLDTGGDIRETAAELGRILKSDKLAAYEDVHIVAHSIGGIITKDYLLNRLEAETPPQLREKHVLFIGTPHIKDTFTPPPIKKFFASIFYFALSNLAKDAMNSTKIKDINAKWINIVEASENRRIKNLVLFGNDDKVVRPEDLSNIFTGEYLVIKGTHLGIAQSKNEFSCTYQILKKKLLDPDSSVDDLGCSAN